MAPFVGYAINQTGKEYLIYYNLGDIVPEDKGWWVYDESGKPDNDVGPFTTFVEAYTAAVELP
jgi:hypothetical protein